MRYNKFYIWCAIFCSVWSISFMVWDLVSRDWLFAGIMLGLTIYWINDLVNAVLYYDE